MDPGNTIASIAKYSHLFVLHGVWYACGGQHNGGASTGRCWTYDLQANAWVQLPFNMNRARRGLSGVQLDDDRYFIIGTKHVLKRKAND